MTRRRAPRPEGLDARELNANKVARAAAKGQLLSPRTFYVSQRNEFDRGKVRELLAILSGVRPGLEDAAKKEPH
ncbi:MAG: hypothetical protein E7774_09985 [Bradyrhizobium sp.]|nr:MAG: hypothetical protein E7774_09985 [Bradyrhizobium sp.]